MNDTPTTTPAAPACVPKLITLSERALQGDIEAREQLQLLGEALLVAGGVNALAQLQSVLHDYAVDRWRQGSRGSAIGACWEHIPEWAAL